MEYQQSNESLLGFGFNETAQSYLRTSAKWERFLAWVNIILLGLGILGCLFGGTIFTSLMYSNRAYGGDFAAASSGMFTFIMIFYAIVLAVVLIPNYYRLMFANKCIKAIDNNDEALLTEALKNLKTYSTFWGILTIILIAIYGIFFLLMLVGLSAMR